MIKNDSGMSGFSLEESGVPPAKIIKRQEVTIYGRQIFLEMLVSEGTCPAPAEEQASLTVSGETATLVLTSDVSTVDFAINGDTLTYGNNSVRLDELPDRIEAGGRCYFIGELTVGFTYAFHDNQPVGVIA